MNKGNIEIRVAPCVVSKCKDEPIALTVASKGEDIKRFPACEKHDKGVYGAVQTRFAPQDYMVAHYTELLK